MTAIGYGVVPVGSDNTNIVYFATSVSDPTSVMLKSQDGNECIMTKPRSLPTFTIPETILLPSTDKKYTLACTIVLCSNITGTCYTYIKGYSHIYTWWFTANVSILSFWSKYIATVITEVLYTTLYVTNYYSCYNM